MLHTWTCLEVGFSPWYIWQINWKGSVSAADQIVVPPEDLWNPQAMAQHINNIGGRLLFLLNIAETCVRLAGASFPFDEKDGYNFNCGAIKDEIWTTAVPGHISDSLVEMCRLKGIRPGRINAIDTLEYRMSLYLSNLFDGTHWLLLPQEPGIRLIVLKNGIPCGSYFFSKDPIFRLKELNRLWACHPAESAVKILDDPTYLWLWKFLQEKGVEVYEQDLRKDMIGAWIKEI